MAIDSPKRLFPARAVNQDVGERVRRSEWMTLLSEVEWLKDAIEAAAEMKVPVVNPDLMWPG